jgi:hypothetical protein
MRSKLWWLILVGLTTLLALPALADLARGS